MNDTATANELVVIEPSNALTVFTAPNAIDPLLDRIRKEIDGFSADVTTPSGRKAIASMAHKVSRAKVYMDNAGKVLVDHHKEIPRKIDATRKRMRDTLDAWRDEVRAPLDAWEEAEAQRVSKHKETLAWLSEMAGVRALDWSAEDIDTRLTNAVAIEIGTCCEEFLAAYESGKAKAVAALTEALEGRRKHDAEQAELARLRAEAAERERIEREEHIAREAAEKARREAEARAEADRKAAEDAARREREAAEQRELALKREAEAAEQRAAEAEAKARRDAAAAKEAERLAAEKREANKRHVEKINAKAVADFVAGGVPADAAALVVQLIASKAVSRISIAY